MCAGVGMVRVVARELVVVEVVRVEAVALGVFVFVCVGGGVLPPRGATGGGGAGGGTGGAEEPAGPPGE